MYHPSKAQAAAAALNLQVFKAHITTSPAAEVLDLFWLYDNRNELPENHRVRAGGWVWVWVGNRRNLWHVGHSISHIGNGCALPLSPRLSLPCMQT